ncbi:hypothetical protein O0L34_g10322 [Tuta absoluta]|nr:hypothetical protein O0L34_g10322 [Tuta absoluta]
MTLLWFALPVAGLFLYCKLVRLSFGINRCSRNLVGKVAIVTGGNSGCGFETAKDFADRGAKVILACRNEERGKKARDDIIEATGNKDVHFYKLDLSSFKSIREFVESFTKNEKRLDILVNNAGDLDLDLRTTEDGILLGMQVNYFSPFLLTNLLLPILKESKPSRIVNVASTGYKFGTVDLDDLKNPSKAGTLGKFKIYANAKLCTILATQELSKHLEGSGVTVNALCPGFVNTNIIDRVGSFFWRYFIKIRAHLMAKDAWEGAQTQIYLAVSHEVKNESGGYYTDCKKQKLEGFASDSGVAKKLWEISEGIVKLQ